MGIEPTSPAWEAGVLPMNYTCTNHNDQSGNRTRVYAVRGRRLDRLTNWPYVIISVNRGDGIRTHGLCVPNAALYQTEPRLDTFDSIIRIVEIVNTNFNNFKNLFYTLLFTP